VRNYTIMIRRNPQASEWNSIASASRAVAHKVLAALRAADVDAKLVSSPPRIGSSGRPQW
jgi:hypothetical protein